MIPFQPRRAIVVANRAASGHFHGGSFNIYGEPRQRFVAPIIEHALNGVCPPACQRAASIQLLAWGSAIVAFMRLKMSQRAVQAMDLFAPTNARWNKSKSRGGVNLSVDCKVNPGTWLGHEWEDFSNVFLQPRPDFIMVAGHHQVQSVRFEEKKNHPDAP